MSKSYYILLTLMAVFFLGRWTGMGLGLNNQRVMCTVHEAWYRADDRNALCPEAGLDSLFRQQLREDFSYTVVHDMKNPVTFHTTLQAREVYGDLEYLKEALPTLIDNALKYSKETVEIRIASRWEGGFIRINFRGNSIGIPFSAQCTIFDKFERVLPRDDGSGQKTVPGFGLGLNYVMNISREHGGYVSVETVQGRFSEFTMSPLFHRNRSSLIINY